MSIIKRILSRYLQVIYYLFKIFPIQNNKIVFSNFEGAKYGDNPKYICEELLRRNRHYKLIWLVKDQDTEMPVGVTQVRRHSIRRFYEEATAKVWIDNYRKERWVRKRSSQFYIQTWHAGIGIKKAEKAAEKTLPKEYIERAKNDSKMANVFLAGSEWEKDKYCNYYWYSGKVLLTGVPKQDPFWTPDSSWIIKNKRKYNICGEKKVVLYAPTFRKNMHDYSLYNLDWDCVLEVLSSKFGGEWIGAIRLHPGLIKQQEKLIIPPSVLNLTDYSDPQEILSFVDVLITDYSSIVFDFAITERPAILYAADYAQYKKDRDVFFNLEDLPFPLALTFKELCDSIQAYDESRYKEEIKKLLYKECGLLYDPKASVQVCNLIDHVIEGGMTL